MLTGRFSQPKSSLSRLHVTVSFKKRGDEILCIKTTHADFQGESFFLLKMVDPLHSLVQTLITPLELFLTG